MILRKSVVPRSVNAGSRWIALDPPGACSTVIIRASRSSAAWPLAAEHGGTNEIL
jgi:hypothetical protein